MTKRKQKFLMFFFFWIQTDFSSMKVFVSNYQLQELLVVLQLKFDRSCATVESSSDWHEITSISVAYIGRDYREFFLDGCQRGLGPGCVRWCTLTVFIKGEMHRTAPGAGVSRMLNTVFPLRIIAQKNSRSLNLCLYASLQRHSAMPPQWV